MSLLDDVSIVVTPNAYKAGTLYGVLPTATEGSELVVNGDFATDSVWTKGTGWTISGGTANVASGSDGAALSQDICQVGVVNRVVFTISNYTGSGFVRLRTGGASQVQDFSANGTYTFDVVPTSVSFSFARYVTGSLSIDNVSVKQFTASDMDVTRATAATRVDENGLVNYAEVLGSELVTNGDFDSNITGWSAKDCTIAWDNGKLKADNSSGNANGGAFQNIGLVTGKTYQMTATMQLLTGSSNGTFNLFTSAAGGTGQTSVYTGSTLVVGGAAVTETFYFTPGSGDVSIQFTCDEANATYTIDNVSVKEVTRNNVPRIDYTGGGCPHILAEPQRTNEIVQSENFSDASYAKTNATLTGGFVSPSGDTTAYKMTATAVNGQVRFGEAFSNTDVKAVSVFAKANTSTSKLTIVEQNYIGTTAIFDLNLGTVVSSTTTSSKIENYGNGWYRCIITQAYSSGQTSVVFALRSATVDSLLLWGAQAETGTFASSYIPTSGSAVTRNQDLFTRDGIGSLINDSEGVLFLEAARLSSADNTSIIWSISDGSNSNAVSLYYASTGVKVDIFNSTGTKTLQHSMSLTEQANFNKLAIKYKSNDIALWVNGNEVATNTDAISLSGLNELISSYGSGSFNFFGKIKQLQVYKTALTDAQLTSLTS